MKVLFIREDLHLPYDEGMKQFAFRVLGEIEKNCRVRIVRDAPSLSSRLNRLLFVPRVWLAGLFFRPDCVIYAPEASLTFFSMVRVLLLRLGLMQRPIVLGLQRRQYANWQKPLVRMIASFAIKRLFVLSKGMAEDLKIIGVRADVIPSGIDRVVFAPAPEKRNELRRKYGLPEDRKVLLHVGHIRESRNVRWFLEIRKALPDVCIVIVGSTATELDSALQAELEKEGIVVLRKYIAAIQELYQLSDCYVFPVLSANAAMETPLSVLEAMAANLPVLTTAFGRLTEMFEEDSCFRYVKSSDDVIAILKDGLPSSCNNREKTEPYGWDSAARVLLEN